MAVIELSDGWRTVLAASGRIALIVVLALVVNALGRRAIRRAVTRMARAAVEVHAKAPARLLGGGAQRAEARAGTLSTLLRSILSVSVFTVGLLMVLSELRVDLAPLLAGAGIVSVAVGFGTQSLVRDIVAGIFVVFEDQYGVGDVIDAGEAVGTVERVTLRSTQLRDAVGTVWHLPNGSIQRVGNRSQNWSAAIVDVVLAVDTDVAAARAVASRVAVDFAADEAWSAHLGGEPQELGVQAIGAEGVTLRVSVDVDPGSQVAVERELRQRLKTAFDGAGIGWGGLAAATAAAMRRAPEGPPA